MPDLLQQRHGVSRTVNPEVGLVLDSDAHPRGVSLLGRPLKRLLRQQPLARPLGTVFLEAEDDNQRTTKTGR